MQWPEFTAGSTERDTNFTSRRVQGATGDRVSGVRIVKK